MSLYTDSDHCGEEKKRSTAGWAVQMNGSLVAWGSKSQAPAVESTCAAQFVAACMGENACMKLKDVMFEMTGKEIDAELLVDSQSAVGKPIRPAEGNTWFSPHVVSPAPASHGQTAFGMCPLQSRWQTY